MQRRVLRRAATAAMTVLLLTAIVAQADTVPADGDNVTAGNRGSIDLGTASPGQTLTWPVRFRLTCAGLSHAEPGATITLDQSGSIVPEGGSVSATTTTIGPVPADWTAANEGCPSPAPTLLSSAPSTVTMTMPPTPGPHDFTVMWSRSGAAGLSGSTAITIHLEVVGNAPPQLNLPTNILAEATSPAGAAVTWTATATDQEDAPPPTPTCSPASGSTFDLGLTTVQCAVTDGGGATASGSFLVSVQDTTVPSLGAMPTDQHLTTTSPTGATLTYALPTATDVADPAPAVTCSPASGSTVPVGATTVTCTATDATGNSASGSFAVDVRYVTPTAWSVRWGEPVATSGSTFVANPGRTVPVKVEIFADGVEQSHGDATLELATCDGGSLGALDLGWDGGRWAAHLDTGRLGGPGCYEVTATLDGHAAGSFRLDLRRDSAAATKSAPAARERPAKGR